MTRLQFYGSESSGAPSGLSYAEHELWLTDHSQSVTQPFFDCKRNLSMVARLKGTIDVSALEASIDAIVQRHDVLRSRFAYVNGEPVRRYETYTNRTLTKIDRQDIAPEGDLNLEQSIAHHVNAPFDLGNGPLLRAVLLRLGGDDHILALAMTHLVFDRWSQRVLGLELKAHYEAYSSGVKPLVDPLLVQYSDYVHWQCRRLTGDNGEKLLQYWKSQLNDLTELVLPRDGACVASLTTPVSAPCVTISADDFTRLATLARARRLSMGTITLAVVMLLLHKISGQEDITVGVPVADRRRPEFEPLIGLFVNVVVVRATVTGAMRILDVLESVRRSLADACRYQDMPYGYLRRVMSTERPLYRVVFNFMPAIPSLRLELAGLEVTPLTIPGEPTSLADLSIHVFGKSGELMCRLMYNAGMFSENRVRQFGERLQALAVDVIESPEKRVDACIH